MNNGEICATRKYFSFTLAKGEQAFCWGIAEDGTIVCDHISAALLQQQKLYYPADELIWPAENSTRELQERFLKVHKGELFEDVKKNFQRYNIKHARYERRKKATQALSEYLERFGYYSWSLFFDYEYVKFEALGAFGSEKKLTEGPNGSIEDFMNGLKGPLAEVIFTSHERKEKATEYSCVDINFYGGSFIMTLNPVHKPRRR